MSRQESPKPSTWDKAKHGSKGAFDKAWGAFERLGGPVNKFTNKIGSEAFWPTTLDKESDKSARILKSFCKDGFYTEQPAPADPTSHGPKQKPKVLVKIPQKVIQNCVGLAIFSVMRTGLWVSGAGGSGVLIAKKEDGSWSPPSGILIHTLGVGFMAGIDIYDCVCVINNREALRAFSKVRVSLGPELSVVAGPLGAGGIVDAELLKDRKPVYSYMKSRGLYAGLQFDGTIIVERNDENARFYGERLPIGAILSGQVRNVPASIRMLMEVAKEAEGRTDVNQTVLNEVAGKPAPSDVDVESVTEPTKEQMEYYAPPATYRPGEPSSYQPGAGYEHPPRTDSGFPAPPPGAPPNTFMSGGASSAGYEHPPRTDSGFAAPPPGPPPSHAAGQAPPTSSEYPPEKTTRYA